MSTWTGETKFELLSDEEAQQKKKDATTLPKSPLDAATDRWERDGTTWVRVHEQPRLALYKPTDDDGGPDPALSLIHISEPTRPY